MDTTREQLKNTYISQLYTQLILNGLASGQAMERAKEAALAIESRPELSFPTIVVG